MTTVVSHQCLPVLINEMPLGSAKDIVIQLYGQTDKSASVFVLFVFFTFTSVPG